MNIGILSKSIEIYSTRRLVEAATARGHVVQVINPIRCYMSIASHKPTIHYKNKPLKHFDAIIPRIGASITFYGTAVVRQFEMMNVFSVNESVAISRSRDKLRLLQLLSKKGIGLPVTGFAHSTQSTEDLINLIGGAPLVIKILEGTQGKGVVLAETPKAAESVIDAFRGLSEHFLVQELIQEAGVADIRVIVIGNRAVTAMMREKEGRDFRRMRGGGSGAVVARITPEERSTAVRAAQALGLNVAGVDILRSSHGPVVMEVNSSPALAGIEKVTGTDVADQIIEFIEKKAKKLSTRTRGEG